ncbi:MAG: hypothetical protein Q8N23_16930 [Archangium sp.]|nr:hypothetical protein [Archangium sp.]MDP3154363.1 hypothetical protein [Archangium sp.]MDP3573032.1 hypothetical protein [Archangium sp.]
MFHKMAGWLALAMMMMASCSGSSTFYGSMERNLSDLVTIEPGQIVVKRYKVSLTASSNRGNEGGLSKVATLSILGASGCVRGSDAGGTCPADGGTTPLVEVAFLDGTKEMKVLPRCGFGVACEQTLQVRLKPSAELAGTLVVNVSLQARVLNAGFATDGLTIEPE